MVRPETSLFDLIKAKSMSNARMKRYAEIGSFCPVPLWSEKYFVVWPPLITHDSTSFNKFFTQSIKYSPKSYLGRTANKKQWFNESKAFLKSKVVKYPRTLYLSQISIISETKWLLSLKNLPFTEAVWRGSIKEGRTFFSLAVKGFDIIFWLKLNKEIVFFLDLNISKFLDFF